jgi:hypothetical protein
MNMTPALPGTFLREWDADGDTRDTPIIGWTYVTGNMGFPIFPVGGRSVGPHALIFVPVGDPDMNIGLWCHPSSQLATGDYAAAESVVVAAMETVGAPEPDLKDRPVDPAGQPDMKPIHFGAATYKTQSFWHWPTANAIFKIEPEHVIPSDARIVKIKRDEFAKLKRDGASVIDPHNGVISDTPPEEPAAEEAGDEDFPDVV